MNLLQRQDIIDALYGIDSDEWGECARQIWEVIGFVFNENATCLFDSLEQFAYGGFNYKYKLTNSEVCVRESISSIVLFKIDDSRDGQLFIAVDMNYFGNEEQRYSEAKVIAGVLNRITNSRCHFLFKCNNECCFVSLIQIEKNSNHFEKTVLGKREYKSKEQVYEDKFVSSEWFSFEMDEERMDKLAELDADDYVRSFVREIEIVNYSAEYIIYELNPVKDAYRMSVSDLNTYCIETMRELYGPEWSNENSTNYSYEIREERLSDEDWDLIEFELEGSDEQELLPSILVKFDEREGEEDDDDFDFDEIPDDVLDDPVELLRWIEENKAKKNITQDSEKVFTSEIKESHVFSSKRMDIDVIKAEYRDNSVHIVFCQKNKSSLPLQLWLASVSYCDGHNDCWKMVGNAINPYQTRDVEFISTEVPYSENIFVKFEIDDTDNKALESSSEIKIPCVNKETRNITKNNMPHAKNTTYDYDSEYAKINLLSINYSTDNMLHLKWRINSYSDLNLNVWIKEILINGEHYDDFIMLCLHLEAYSDCEEELQVDLDDINLSWNDVSQIEYVFEVDDIDNSELDMGTTCTVNITSKVNGAMMYSVNSELSMTHIEKTELFNVMGTIQDLLEEVDYELPIDIQKDNWTSDYHFVVTSVRNGYAYGNTYNGNILHKATSYPVDRKYHIYRFYQG